MAPPPDPAPTAPALVGRDREQATLRDHLAAALAGRGSLVLIGGEAGLGKTTLAEALLNEAAAQGALVLVGRCYDLTETPPYGPWAEALDRAPTGEDRPTPPDLAPANVPHAPENMGARPCLAVAAIGRDLALTRTRRGQSAHANAQHDAESDQRMTARPDLLYTDESATWQKTRRLGETGCTEQARPCVVSPSVCVSAAPLSTSPGQRAGKAQAMRVLFTTTPFYGHLHPLLPFARALADAGHTIAFAAPAPLAEAAAHADFHHLPAGLDSPINDVYPELQTWRGPDRVAFMQRAVFGDLLPRRMAADILALAATWSPDLVIRETAEYGGCLAAEALGLPHAMVIVHVARGDGHYQEDLVAPLAARRVALGLPPDPRLAMLTRYLVLDCAPPGYRDPAYPTPPTLHALRPALPEFAAFGAPPPWLADLPDRPAVYVGFGTDPSKPKRPALLAAVLAGLRDEPLNVVATVGADPDPATYGPQPPNVRVERFLPLAHLLPRCDLVVCHGGSGTTLAALAHGLPLVIVPLGADMPDNAARCEALGVGRTLPPADCTPEAVRDHVRALLADPAYRANAARLREATAALPGIERAVALLERLAVEKRPLPA